MANRKVTIHTLEHYCERHGVAKDNFTKRKHMTIFQNGENIRKKFYNDVRKTHPGEKIEAIVEYNAYPILPAKSEILDIENLSYEARGLVLIRKE